MLDQTSWKVSRCAKGKSDRCESLFIDTYILPALKADIMLELLHTKMVAAGDGNHPRADSALLRAGGVAISQPCAGAV